MCEEARQMSKENQQHWNQATKVTTIMEAKNLPFLPTAWGYRIEGRAKKVIAGIVYKYVKDQMYKGKIPTPATEVSKKYALNATTMNRHILGKKYAGGKASMSGTRKLAALKATSQPVDKSTNKLGDQADERIDTTSKGKGAKKRPVDKSSKKLGDEAEEQTETTSKGKDTGKHSSVSWTAKEIQSESTSDQQKEKSEKRKAEEAELEEEDDDGRPTAAEIAASKPPRKNIVIHH